MSGMKPGMMMVLNKASQYERMPRNEYGGDPERRMIGFDRDYPSENRRRYAEGEGWQGGRMSYDGMGPEAQRRRDGRGRYMEGDYTPQMGGYCSEYDEGRYGMDNRYEPESRRRRDSRGRYMMGGMDDGDMRGQTWYPPNNSMPQMMAAPMGTAYPMGMHGGGSRYGFGDVHADIYAPNAMNRPMGGMMGGEMSKPVDEHTARKWVSEMDGGEHFKPEQVEPLRNTLCPDCDKWEWYTAMNAMYSDHCETAKKMGIDKPEFYAHMAKDFLKDADAKPHKLRNYMTYIA